jgi:hypothetical protein
MEAAGTGKLSDGGCELAAAPGKEGCGAGERPVGGFLDRVSTPELRVPAGKLVVQGAEEASGLSKVADDAGMRFSGRGRRRVGKGKRRCGLGTPVSEPGKW